MTKRYLISFKDGLHMRPLSKMVEISRRYKSVSCVNFNGISSNMKSLVEMILLDVNQNDVIEIEVIGDDAKELFMEIQNLMIEEI